MILGASFFGYTLFYNYSLRSKFGLFGYGSTFLIFLAFMKNMRSNYMNYWGLKLELSKCGNYLFYDTYNNKGVKFSLYD